MNIKRPIQAVSSFIKKRKINRLKAKAKKLYLKYYNETSVYGCGNTLIENIRPDLAAVRIKFNDVMAELKVLDPNCVDFKL